MRLALGGWQKKYGINTCVGGMGSQVAGSTWGVGSVDVLFCPAHHPSSFPPTSVGVMRQQLLASWRVTP